MRRIIPARAGFTKAVSAPACIAADHPRSRGVYVADARSFSADWGSSPLARGLQTHLTGDQARLRIIPARAGFTGYPPRPRCRARDHPRSRGVYTPSPQSLGTRSGSSPLARGLPSRQCCSGCRTRIIPARAGFTPAGKRWTLRLADHPRSRGVYQATGVDDVLVLGSSPLARGLQVRLQGPVEACRIIPARAGFTPSPHGEMTPRPDHPRSRGVYEGFVVLTVVDVGSSPLARGLHALIGLRENVRRIIPARAGFTRPSTTTTR